MTVDVDVDPTVALRALAEPVRWRIVELLANEQLCVCHLATELGLAQSLISHHLRALREARLVATERYRYWTYYRLRPAAIAVLTARLHELAVTAPASGERRRRCD